LLIAQGGDRKRGKGLYPRTTNHGFTEKSKIGLSTSPKKGRRRQGDPQHNNLRVGGAQERLTKPKAKNAHNREKKKKRVRNESEPSPPLLMGVKRGWDKKRVLPTFEKGRRGEEEETKKPKESEKEPGGSQEEKINPQKREKKFKGKRCKKKPKAGVFSVWGAGDQNSK